MATPLSTATRTALFPRGHAFSRMTGKHGHAASRRQRGGYVLVVALAMLVLAASLMAGVARATFRHVVRARAAQEDLQRRWGEASVRRAILPYVDSILTTQEQRLQRPLPVLRTRLELGTMAFDLVLADEQAKANINLLLDGGDLASVETQLRNQLTGSGLMNHLRLHPALNPTTRPAPTTAPTTQAAGALAGGGAARQAPTNWITGYGQLFDGIAPQQWLAPGFGSVAPVDLVTCWGDGSLNVRRAGNSAMKLALMPALSGSDVARLGELRDSGFKLQGSVTPSPVKAAAGASRLKRAGQQPTLDPAGRILQDAGIDASGVNKVLPLDATSSCFSLWVVARGPLRAWYSFSVLDRSDPTRVARPILFVW